MKIGIIGTGHVGSTLGQRWAQQGHEILFGTRNPNAGKVQQLLSSLGDKALAVDTVEVESAEIIVLATPWKATETIVKSLKNVKNKILVDCTNPLKEGSGGLAVGHTTSGGEQVAEWAAGARVVKAFNTTGSGNMANPMLGSEKATMYICGDDAEAKKVVSRLAAEIGFDPCDTGPLYHARYFEPMAMLWIDMAYAQGKRAGFCI